MLLHSNELYLFSRNKKVIMCCVSLRVYCLLLIKLDVSQSPGIILQMSANRIEEHRTSLSSAVCRHLQANPDHRVDFHNPEVIGSDNNWRWLQILESLLIQEHKPELNANIPSMPLCIFNL